MERNRQEEKSEGGRKRWIGPRYLIDSKTDGCTPQEAARKTYSETASEAMDTHMQTQSSVPTEFAAACFSS